MLVSEPVGNITQRCYQCLDLLQVRFETASHEEIMEDAVLLEVWETGGLLQTEREALCGSFLDFVHPAVRGEVKLCSKDDYGYLVEFTASPANRWFPAAYQPPYLSAKAATLE